jgi:hypothetical protein
MSFAVELSYENHLVVVSGKNKTIPFTDIDRVYLEGYVGRNLPRLREEFVKGHHCAKCPPTDQRKKHADDLFWAKCQEGKVFFV